MRKMASDTKAFYGYLFEVDKKPTRTLDALLRGIAGYIVSRPATTLSWILGLMDSRARM